MKYKSSLTKEIKLAILLLLLFWVINILVIINSNGIKDAIIASLLIFGFAIVFVSALVRGIYIVIENNSVKYVHMFLLKKTLEIVKINEIQKGSIKGVFKALLLIYTENGKVKHMKISLLTFKKETLKQFVSDLKKQNPQINIAQSASEFIS